MDLIPIIGTIWTWWKAALICIAVASLTFFVGRCEGDRAARIAINNAILKNTVQAERRASQDERVRQVAANNRAQAIEGALTNAVESHPEESNRTAGPASSAVLDELRRRRKQ